MNNSRFTACWPLCLGLALMITFGPLRLSLADENPASADDKPASQQPDEAQTQPEFAVPDGTAQELFDFINKVKQTPPTERTRDGIIAHLKKQVKAVMAACDKVMAGNPTEDEQLRVVAERLSGYEVISQIDEDAAKQLEQLLTTLKEDKRPVVQRLVSSLTLRRRAQDVFSMTEKQQQEYVGEIIAWLDTYGLDQRMFELTNKLAQVFEDSPHPQQAARLYSTLAKQLKKLNRSDLTSEIQRMEAVVRRLSLPGQFMELKGTTVDGKPFDWDAYRGKVVLVDFWASWCGPCRAEIPNVKAQLEQYGDRGFTVVGVNLDETPEACQKVVEQEQLPWVNLMSQNPDERGWNNPIATHYGISGIPTAILVDKEGKVVSLNARGPELRRLLAELLGEPKDSATDE